MRVRCLVAALFVGFAQASTSDACRCFPGDECWPSEHDWSQFNQSIRGRLVKTVPLGAPCHVHKYNSTKCVSLKEEWLLPEVHYESSSSVMAPFFANGTCDPFHPISKPCELGNYVRYAVNVSTPTDISKAVRFATDNNIRVVIRNTGHDYNGKSTGAGALAIWTHNLKSLRIHDYKDSHYSGKAMTMGAGIQGFKAYEAADRAGLEVVGGECPTVGIPGGYTQGGGHSHLASRHGLAADQVLKWEAVDGEGNIVTATRDNEYSDLFWALAGGGGGTYAVVYSMTAKAHPGTPVSGLKVSFTNANISQDTFNKAVSIYHINLAALVDAGAMSIWFYTNTTFALSPLTGPNIPEKKLVSLLNPFLKGLKGLAINYTFESGQYDSYYSEFKAMQRTIGVGEAQYGGWLIPRSVVEHNNTALTKAYREITEDGGTFIGVGLNVSREVTGDVYNSVLPAWRDALIATTLPTPWKWNAPKEMVAMQRKMTNEFMPKIQALAPASGAYLNEADFRQPDFKTAFYGRNYAALRRIKTKYDPHDLFYGTTAVGSDEWTELEDGRLCRADNWKSHTARLHVH